MPPKNSSPVPNEAFRPTLNDGPLEIPKDPMVALVQWMDEARLAGALEPTAMTLATVSKEGRPNARIVLFKGTSPSKKSGQIGIEFYTNYESQKSRELIDHPWASLVFYWPLLRRQIRFSGAVERLTAEQSAPYFESRARGSRIGAWASPQSQKIGDRDELVQRVVEVEARFADREIPCPPYWGGWRVVPDRIEFWEERLSRLHERQLFERSNDDAWSISRLAP